MCYTLLMNTINRTLILETAEFLIEQQGMRKTSLSQVAKELGVSHAALYKYFANKEDLWTSLAFGWLNKELVDVFHFDPRPYDSKVALLHDWLWTLTESKKKAYDANQKMFKLYTTYIDNNPVVLNKHMHELKETMSELLHHSNDNDLSTILEAFVVFSAPSFAHTWDAHLQGRFEAVWTLMLPGLTTLLGE